jgi:hypothetical protein
MTRTAPMVLSTIAVMVACAPASERAAVALRAPIVASADAARREAVPMRAGRVVRSSGGLRSSMAAGFATE